MQFEKIPVSMLNPIECLKIISPLYTGDIHTHFDPKMCCVLNRYPAQNVKLPGEKSQGC